MKTSEMHLVTRELTTLTLFLLGASHVTSTHDGRADQGAEIGVTILGATGCRGQNNIY